MNWFGRKEEPFVDPQIPPEVYQLEPVPPADRSVAAVSFGDKPADLVEAAAVKDWTRSEFIQRARPSEPVPIRTETQPLTLPWTRETPTVAGCYWYCNSAGSEVEWCVVLQFGRGLCVRKDGVYTSVALLHHWWSGPFASPQYVGLEELA